MQGRYEVGSRLAEHCDTRQPNVFGPIPFDGQRCLVGAFFRYVLGELARRKIELGQRVPSIFGDTRLIHRSQNAVPGYLLSVIEACLRVSCSRLDAMLIPA